MNLEIIRELSVRYNGGIRKLAQDINMSESNLHRCINHNQIQASHLEQIAQRLQVPVSLFFDNQPGVLQSIERIRFTQSLNDLRQQSQKLTDMIQQITENINQNHIP